jgi:hypothetical protein
MGLLKIKFDKTLFFHSCMVCCRISTDRHTLLQSVHKEEKKKERNLNIVLVKIKFFAQST